MLSSTQSATFTDYKLSHHTLFGTQDKIMPKIQIYFIACVVHKITFKLDARRRHVCVHSMKAYMGSRDINPLIHNLVIRWRLLVSLMLWPLYSQRKSPLYELSSRLGGSQNQSGYLKEKKILIPTGNQTSIIQSTV
jgi:hypothetical protein